MTICHIAVYLQKLRYEVVLIDILKDRQFVKFEENSQICITIADGTYVFKETNRTRQVVIAG